MMLTKMAQCNKRKPVDQLISFSLPFVACDKLLKRTSKDNIQLIFLQPTMSGQRMVIGNILTGNSEGLHGLKSII